MFGLVTAALLIAGFLMIFGMPTISALFLGVVATGVLFYRVVKSDEKRRRDDDS